MTVCVRDHSGINQKAKTTQRAGVVVYVPILWNFHLSRLLTHAGQKPGDGLHIGSGKDVRQRVDHRQTHGVHADPPFT